MMSFLSEETVVLAISLAIELPAGKGTPVHRNRSSHGLALNVSHTTRYRFESGEDLICGAGDCIYLPQGANYTVECFEDAAKKSSTFAINFLLDSNCKNAPFVIHPRGKEELFSLFSKAANAWRKKEAGFYEECFSDLYRILRNLKRERADQSPQGAALKKLAPALHYIQENYTEENVPLAHLAALCGVSQPYLRRLFHRALQTSPALYMRALRLEYARELLLSGEYSVTDASFASGFNDTAYFSREFKKYFGISPLEWVRTT